MPRDLVSAERAADRRHHRRRSGRALGGSASAARAPRRCRAEAGRCRRDRTAARGPADRRRTGREATAASTGPAVVDERIGHWAAGYFDQGQALWAAPQAGGAYAAWRSVASHDLTPEIVGLAGFARIVGGCARRAPRAALVDAVGHARPSEAALESYFHRLLTSLGGWAQLARYAAVAGGTWRRGRTRPSTDLLAIRLVWEAALARASTQPEIGPQLARCACRPCRAGRREPRTTSSMPSSRKPPSAPRSDGCDGLLAERAPPRRLRVAPALQVAFCIDVRSEVFRRALEQARPRHQNAGLRRLLRHGDRAPPLRLRRGGAAPARAAAAGLSTCSGELTPADARRTTWPRASRRGRSGPGAASSSPPSPPSPSSRRPARSMSASFCATRSGSTGSAAPNDPAPRPVEHARP